MDADQEASISSSKTPNYGMGPVLFRVYLRESAPNSKKNGRTGKVLPLPSDCYLAAPPLPGTVAGFAGAFWLVNFLMAVKPSLTKTAAQ
jgi:hypothetical protein